MNNTVSAKCYSCILSDLKQFSLILRRSRKYNCKKGGVDCEVSRRKRDIPNTFGVILVLTALFTGQELLITILQAIAGLSHSQKSSLSTQHRPNRQSQEPSFSDLLVLH